MSRASRRQPAHGGRLDGTARRHRTLRRGHRQLHAARLLAGRDALRDRCRHMGCRTSKLRVLTDDVGGAFGMKTAGLSRIYRAAGRRQQARPAGALDVEPLGSVPQRQPGARHRSRKPSSRSTRRATSWRCAFAIPPIMGAYVGAVGANIHDLQFRPLLAGHVRHQAHRRHRSRCVFTNTIADRALSRRRPAGSELRARARGRRSRARHRHRPACGGARQSHPAVGDAVQDRGRHHLRQRRLPGDLRQGAGACRLRRLQARRREAAKRKKQRGIGISCLLEHSGGCRSRGASLDFPGGDTLTLGLNVQSTGQGHATVFPRLLAEQLGIDAAQISIGMAIQRSRSDGLCLGRLALGDDARAAPSSTPLDMCWRRARTSPRSCSKRRRPTSHIAAASSRSSAPTADLAVRAAARAPR